MKPIVMSNKKMIIPKYIKHLQIFVLLNLLLMSPAYAYVDPGSGSVIVTTILGLIAAVGYTFRKYFYKAKRMLTGKKLDEEEQQQQQTNKNGG